MLTKKLKIFVASPSDLVEERRVLSEVVEGLRRNIGDMLNIELELIRWETHTWPDFGEDAQDVINQEIDEYDILIGLMWRRLGTPTKRAQSGTVEEFDRALELHEHVGRPKIMFYFKTTPFYIRTLEELAQFQKVLKFRKRLEKCGAFSWEYNELLQFEREIRNHLSQQIRRMAQRKDYGHEFQNTNISQSERFKYEHSEVQRKTGFIFITYAPEDEQFFNELRASLESKNLNVWIDFFNMRSKRKLTDQVEKAICEAQKTVIIFSRDSIKSPWLKEEIQSAQKIERQRRRDGYRVIPLLLPGVDISVLDFWFDEKPIEPALICQKQDSADAAAKIVNVLWRQQAIASYLSYRQVGGGNHERPAQLCAWVDQALRTNKPVEMQQTLAQLKNAIGSDDKDNLFIDKLQAILSGNRNPTLAADPNLHYQHAAELQLLLEGLEAGKAD